MRQRVLITAGADGIGLEIAKCFLKKNALVWVADLNQNAIDNLPKSINARCVDVCDEIGMRALFDEISKTWGGLDVLCANAGIDKSNVEKNTVLLLPEDPNKSAHKFRKKFESLANVPIAVIISDTFGRAWRKGQVNFAIGSSGINPIDSYIGKLDSFDNELNATEIAVIDELASAAELVMKKTIDIPIAIIRGVDYENSKLTANELIRDDNEDFFL